MDIPQETERDNAAHQHMKETIDGNYPSGWFVAIEDAQVLAAAADFHELERLLRTLGRDPRHVLVVESGVDYPEYVSIFV